MDRRALLGSLGIGLTTTLAGCASKAIGDATSALDEARDAPTFNAGEDGLGKYSGVDAESERPKREVEAEAVGCVVRRYFGLDTSGSAFYLAAWQDDDTEVL